MLFKSSLKLISEMAKAECGDSVQTLNMKNLDKDYTDILGNIKTIASSDFVYDPRAVNVQATRVGNVVEADDLAKYMVGAKVHDIREALDQIAVANGCEKGSVGICVDEDAILETKAEADKEIEDIADGKKTCHFKGACTCGAKKAVKDYTEGMEFIKYCCEQGIAVYKRNSKVNF
jgi:hypothetical protein